MSISDKLKELQNQGQPQTLDALFQSSKEGMLLDKVKSAVNVMLPAMKENMKAEIMAEMKSEVEKQIGSIKVQNGQDGISPDPKEVARLAAKLIPVSADGKPGKDAQFNKDELVAEIMAKIPRGRKSSGGGSTMRVDNLSSQITGATRVFTATHRIGAAHLLFYSSAPMIFLPTTDYSISGTTVTLGVSIDFPAVGQSLAIIYESSD